MRSPRAVFLTGFMGSGKTIIGRVLAARLHWQFLDLDDAVESAAGMTIAEMFENFGEPYFRDAETAELDRLSAEAAHRRGLVLALGGGTFASERNRQILKGRGVTAWLDVPVEKAWKRVSRHSHRPLGRDREAFERLYESRRSLYALADLHVPVVSDNPEVTASSIQALVRPEWKS